VVFGAGVTAAGVSNLGACLWGVRCGSGVAKPSRLSALNLGVGVSFGLGRTCLCSGFERKRCGEGVCRFIEQLHVAIQRYTHNRRRRHCSVSGNAIETPGHVYW
jgi:hypothetical protein